MRSWRCGPCTRHWPTQGGGDEVVVAVVVSGLGACCLHAEWDGVTALLLICAVLGHAAHG